MFPTLEGIMARRILVNFRAEPRLVASLVPRPLEVTIHRGFAVVGICLIRLEQLRPKGFPQSLGVSSENMAHRVAIRFKEDGKTKNGVFIWRRDTDQNLTALLGGRLFPGLHSKAKFKVEETSHDLSMQVKTRKGEADVHLKVENQSGWKPTDLFKTFGEARTFFQKGDCGFSCAYDEGRLEGMRLETLKWEMEPVLVKSVYSAFYEKLKPYSPKGLQFDCALRMKGIPHQWHELKDIPELAATL
jgi:hypothetical protein